MLLLLDLVLQEVDASQKLTLRLKWLLVTEPECVHLDLLKLQILLSTVVGANE